MIFEKKTKGDADFQRIMSIVDPNNTNFVSFDSFMDFMTRDASDQDTADQIIQSFRVLANNKVIAFVNCYCCY